jgi:hypothetical protein
MTNTEQLRQDLDYVAGALRRRDGDPGVPAIYFLWAAIVLVGFALPDLAPRLAGPFWLAAGVGGGLLSMWLGGRDARINGMVDAQAGRRYGYHWLVVGIGFLLSALPMLLGRADPQAASTTFLLVAGLGYALAGVHLNRPLLWSGLVMLAAYGLLQFVSPPYTWTVTGMVIAASLAWAGVTTRRARATGSVALEPAQ